MNKNKNEIIGIIAKYVANNMQYSELLAKKYDKNINTDSELSYNEISKSFIELIKDKNADFMNELVTELYNKGYLTNNNANASGLFGDVLRGALGGLITHLDTQAEGENTASEVERMLAEKIREEQERAARLKQTIIIVSVIGGIVVFGTILYFVTKKKK